ncbi:MAG: TCR/Tet family MFS transporter [Planctomycetota bacterium]
MKEQKLRRMPLMFILITILIDAIGFGLIVPVMPALLEELLGESSDVAAKWGGYLTFAYAAMHFLFGPMIGNLSDRFGRRPVLLLSLAALVIDYLIMGFANTIGVLFLGRVLSGICGATFPTANAYIADLTDQEKRTEAFGLVGAAFGIGFILGPALGGLLGSHDARTPFFAAASLALANMVYGFFVLPESLMKENRREFSLARANPLGALAHFKKLAGLKPLFLVSLLYGFAHLVYPSTWNFHADARYQWSSQQIGWSLMAFGICSAIVQGGLIRWIVTRLGQKWTAILGLSLNAIGFVGFAFAYQPWLIFFWIPLSAMGAIAGPSINSLMSSKVGPDSQGELQGAISSVSAIANMFSPLLMTQTFAFFLSSSAPVHFHGSAFILAAILTVAAILALVFIRETKKTGSNEPAS